MGKENTLRWFGFVTLLLFCARPEAVRAESIPRWHTFELVLTAGGSYAQPYLKIPGNNTNPGFVVGTFTGPDGTQIEIDGFWSGGDAWVIRMAPTLTGTWMYATSSEDPQLDGRSGSFECVPSTSKGFIEVDAAHPHHFRWSDGMPFPMAPASMTVHGYEPPDSGFTTPYISGTMTDGSFQRYVDTRVLQGFTALHWGIVLSKWGKRCSCHANEGGRPFIDGDLDRLNPAYFDWADHRVEYAVAAGLAPQFGITWPDSLWAGWSHERLKRLWRYVIARYSAYNVTWNLFGEGFEWNDIDDAVSICRDYGDLTKRLDPYDHPVTVHTAPAGVLDDAWLDFIDLQATTRETSYALGHAKPVVNAEYLGYEGLQVDGNRLRFMIWDVRMRGGYFVYETWAKDLELPGAEFSRLNNLFFREHTRFWLLEYHPELFGGGPGLANPGHEYVTYMPGNGTVRVDLSGTPHKFQVEWYDPRTGIITGKSSTTGGGVRAFSTPTSADWVLHIYRLPGDFDGNGVVDLAEFGRFQICFCGTGGSPPDACPDEVDADLDGDGDVDAIDYGIFHEHFSTQGVTGSHARCVNQ